MRIQNFLLYAITAFYLMISCSDNHIKKDTTGVDSQMGDLNEISPEKIENEGSDPDFYRAIHKLSNSLNYKIFSDNRKVIINPVFLQAYREGVAGVKENLVNTIPRTINLAFVLNEKNCVNLPSYFSDDLIRKFSQSRQGIEVVSGFLKSAISFSILDADSKRIPCLIGISTTEGMVASQLVNSGDATDFLSSIRLTESLSEWKSLIGEQKVKIGLVDTGVDIDNDDLSSVSKSLKESDRVDLDDVPDDNLGHGTAVASVLISNNQKQKRVTGMFPSNIELIPVKVMPRNGVVLNHQVANGIIHAVNLGAEVINLSFGGQVSGCDAVIGYAIDFAIQQNVFVTIAAGDRNSLLMPARRNNLLSYEPTSNPACWGLYFKGAVTVAAMNSSYTRLLDSSNYGAAIEMAAPGEAINVYTLNSGTTVRSGTSLAAPMVAGSVAMMIAAHKNKKWTYTPALLEDILLNSSPSQRNLADRIYKGKFLDLLNTVNYLNSLTTKTDEQRLAETVNDPSLGDGYRFADNGRDRVVRLEIQPDVQLNIQSGKTAIRAKAFFANGSYFVVSDKVKWSVSNPSFLTINSNGVAFPSPLGIGKSAIVSAEYEGFSTSILVGINSLTDIRGEDSQIEEISIRHHYTTSTSVQFRLIATYSDGSLRNLTDNAVWSSSDENMFRHRGRWDNSTRDWNANNVALSMGEFVVNPELISDSIVQIHASYGGNVVKIPFTIRPIEFDFGYIAIGLAGNGGGYWNQDGKMGSETISYNMVKELKYTFLAKALYKNARSVDNLNSHRGTFISGHDEIKFRKVGSSETPVNQFTGDQAELWIHPDISIGNYQIRFESDLVYPSKLNHKFTVKINLKIEPEKLVSLSLIVDKSVPWGSSFKPISISGVYSTGLSKLMPITDFDVSFSSLESSNLERVWLKPDGEFQAYLKVFEKDLVGKQIQIKARYKKNDLTTNKVVNIKGLSNHSINRVPSIPNISQPPSPKVSSSFCTKETSERRPFAAGKGTETDPFLICNYEQLKQISLLNTGNLSGHSGFLNIKLANHIDLSTIPSSEKILPIKVFKAANFDGDNFEIQNLVLDDRSTNLISFFDSGNWHKISNMIFRNANVKGKNSVSVLMASTSTTLRQIENISLIDGSVEGDSSVGTIIGSAFSSTYKISIHNIRIYNTKVIGIRNSVGSVAGRLVDNFTIRNVYSSADVLGKGDSSQCVGGLIGSGIHGGYFNFVFDNYPSDIGNTDEIEGQFVLDSLFNGKVDQQSTQPGISIPGGSVGGIVGCADYVTIADVENRGAVGSSGSNVGGIVGRLSGLGASHFGLIYRASNLGVVVAGKDTSPVKGVGGIVGYALNGSLHTVISSEKIHGFSNLGGVLGKSLEFVSIRNADFNSNLVILGTAKNGAIIGSIHPILTSANILIRPHTQEVRWLDSNLKEFGD